jgi:hypothetical protein
MGEYVGLDRPIVINVRAQGVLFDFDDSKGRAWIVPLRPRRPSIEGSNQPLHIASARLRTRSPQRQKLVLHLPCRVERRGTGRTARRYRDAVRPELPEAVSRDTPLPHEPCVSPRQVPSMRHGLSTDDSAWNVVTASSGALNHLFRIVRVADVARKKTCERRPIHQPKVARRTPSWYWPGSPGCHRQRS